MNLKTKKNYKFQFCNNTFQHILYKASYFDSGSVAFWQEVDRGKYLKPLIKRNKKQITN